MASTGETYVLKRVTKHIRRRARRRGKLLTWSKARKIARATARLPLAVEQHKPSGASKAEQRLHQLDVERLALLRARLANENARTAKRGSTMRARRAG